MDNRFKPTNDIEYLLKIIEECGEVLAAAGKTLRYGYDSYNPLLPKEEQEWNITWLKRELVDLELAIKGFHGSLPTEYV